MSQISSMSGLNLHAVKQQHKKPQVPTSGGSTTQSLSDTYSQVAQHALKKKK